MRRLFSVLPLLAIAVIARAQGGVPDAVMAKLSRGANVTRWFGYLPNPLPPDHFETYLTDQDFAQFKRYGMTFIRLALAPSAIFDASGPKESVAPHLDQAIERLRAAGLFAILDLHNTGQLNLEDPTTQDSFVHFWEGMAKRYDGKYRQAIAFELVNEPAFKGHPKDWYALQTRTVAAIRAIDPNRTIVVTGAEAGGIDGLGKMAPLKASNLIYSFHFYDPFWFTHQGASWAGQKAMAMKNVPFPSSPETVAGPLANVDPIAKDSLRYYGERRYDKGYIYRRMKYAEDYERTFNVPVMMGEFGAYTKSDPDSRARWYSAVRDAVKAFNMPNAIWGYDDPVGLGRTLDGSGVHLDPVPTSAFYGL